MDKNTLLAIEQLCDLARDSTTTEIEYLLVNSLAKLVDPINPNIPEQRAGDETV